MTRLLGFRAVIRILIESPLYWIMRPAERLKLAKSVLAEYLS